MSGRQRDRLGRGLGALLGEYLEERPVEGGDVRQLAVGAITPNPFQPRREFGEEELAELAQSIRENGLLQPIVVRPAPAGSGAAWQLVAGERRWRAVSRLGWAELPAMVRDVDDRTLLVLALVENLQRASLSPIEEAQAYRQLADEFGLSHGAIADTVGRDRSTVANTLRLLQLPAAIRRMVEDGRLSAGHARALLGLDNERRMIELARRAIQQAWSVRETEQHVRRGRPEKKPKQGRPLAGDAVQRRLEEVLQQRFGTPARIRRSRGERGRIEIPFYGMEDFERVFELMTGDSATDVIS
ncbi:MAG: ParB/RepB/Spo0J family partition protein [Longimicrobiales bacterium]